MITTPVKLWRRGKKLVNHIGLTGELLHWTIVRVPPKNFADQAPYPVGIVRLSTGEMMVGQLVDWTEKDLKSGMRVVAVMRRITHEDKENIIPYGIKFKPL
jgi:uncharacterized OB-fold protein